MCWFGACNVYQIHRKCLREFRREGLEVCDRVVTFYYFFLRKRNRLSCPWMRVFSKQWNAVWSQNINPFKADKYILVKFDKISLIWRAVQAGYFVWHAGVLWVNPKEYASPKVFTMFQAFVLFFLLPCLKWKFVCEQWFSFVFSQKHICMP